MHVRQAEYLKERLEWSALEWEDNLPVIHLLAKKPVGIFHLLDDESNFPRANDLSFLEKCHYNHALNELYSRPRIGAQEFGITHYAGQVWYSVEGFLEKNRDALRMDVIELLSSSSDPLVGEMTKQLKAQRDIGKTLPRGVNGRFVTMKPRTPTVAARFSDSLQQLLQSMAKCNPWFVRCVKPNNDKQALRMDMPCVLQQLRYLGMLDTIKIRQCGYPVRLRFQHFVERYKHMLRTPLPRGTPYRELSRFVLESLPGTNTEGPDFQLGATRVFLRESLHRVLEAIRSEKLRLAAVIIQKNVRGMLARKRMYRQQRGATAIQKQWRGYRERKKYVSLKTGIVKAQAILLRSENGSRSTHYRVFPPSWLEWRASSRLSDTALVLQLADGVMQTVAVDSWTTCEEAAALAISSLGIPNLGWTVVIDDNGIFTDSSGLDYVLDLVSEKELCPAFPLARLTSDQLKCDTKNINLSPLEPDGSPKRPQVPPPEPPSAKRLSDTQVQTLQGILTHSDSKVERNEIDPEYTRHMESLARKSSHDAMSRNKIHSEYFESDKSSRSRSLDDLLVSDTNEHMNVLTEPVSLKHRMANHYQSNDEITPLKEPQPRYVKSQYAGKRSAGSHSSKYMDRSEMSIRSSAMSDTSEAPSLASHVRRVRVPSQASDVDQFLDDLFSPVLDGSLDELSDARSLAASIRGSTKCTVETATQDYVGMVLSSIQPCATLSSLNYGTGIYTAIKGGGTAHQPKNNSVSSFNSPPAVPPANPNSLLMMTSPSSSDVTIPTYHSNVQVDNAARQQQVQRAFLQSAMAQNIQIQQQLIAQNQALQTLLIQQEAPTSSTINNSSSKHNASVSPSTPQIFNRKSSMKKNEMIKNRKDSSSASLIPPPPPPPLPPPLELKDPLEVRPFLDPYGRAKTVRIGKWRWPPPQDAAGGEVDENFIQFKMRYANRKNTPQSQSNSNIESPIGSPTGIDWDEFEIDSQIMNPTINAQNTPDQKSNQRVAKRSFDIGADRPTPNSVGKLKLSNEMRQRLEQVTAGHSIRSTSTRSDRTERIPAKLEDTRRMILEQQLGGVMSNRPVADLPSVKTHVQRMETDKRSPPKVWPSVRNILEGAQLTTSVVLLDHPNYLDQNSIALVPCKCPIFLPPRWLGFHDDLAGGMETDRKPLTTAGWYPLPCKSSRPGTPVENRCTRAIL
ncbi:myosin xv [Culex quinquefasciatus]|uniref:Myosin xv n=2 Tax=Culex pipiens complex TaxID=518105 RepID=B0X945_CULQU|nr:myosin xv [Culex quinquefasciatus]|eukprot:XP_001866167.1 myosin xv [Culex quinquefasciatus]